MIGAKERRNRIKKRLSEGLGPVTGTELASENNVSRQVIVQDMAVLRASGIDIQAGPRGYRILGLQADELRMVVAVRHGAEETEEELFLLVDSGVEVVDVVVEHEIYGEIRGYLDLACRDDVIGFLDRLRLSNSVLLSEITGGVHLHTIAARSREKLNRAVELLKTRGFLVE